MNEQPKFMIDPQNSVPMDERTGSHPQPQQAIFYRLESATRGRTIQFHYTARRIWTGLSSHDDFKAKMTKLIAQEKGDIGDDPAKRTRDNNAQSTNRSKDTLLSINFENIPLSYIVIKLSSRYHWQFSRTVAPFMMDKSDKNRNCFLEARRFDSAGNLVDDNNETKDGCRFSYFIADPSKFITNANNEFQHRFNIHIDLLEMDGATIDSYMPIIIDPDVRHPGGNGQP